jgi:hypothetical protein
VVNFHTWAHLDRLLARLAGPGAKPGDSIEVVVVDNDPADPAFAPFAAAHPEAVFVKAEANWGYAAGCNLGARHTRGSWLVFMNPDVHADAADVLDLVRTLRDSPAFRILSAPQTGLRGRPQRAFGRFTTWATHFGLIRAIGRLAAPSRFPDPRRTAQADGTILPVDWVSGSLLAIGRRDFEALGGWCEDYWMYYEDQDLCRRAADRGWRTGFRLGGLFVHQHGASSRQSEAVTIVAKSEVLVSRHLYVLKHCPGRRGAALRAWMRWSAAARGAAFGILDRAALGRIRPLRIAAHVHRRAAAVFRAGAATGVWTSPLSVRASASTGAPPQPPSAASQAG